MTRARASMFSALAGGLVVAVVMAVLPAVAAEGEPLVLGEKNLSATVTRLNTRGGLRIDNFKTGNPALILNVADPAGAPFQVNATGLVDNLNADTVDGQDADAFALDGHEHSGVYAEDAHDHGWADIVSGIPAGLADGDDDTLAGLSCDPGQVIKWNPGGTAWECADDTDTVPTDADTLDGLDSTDFLGASAQAADSAQLGGLAPSAYRLAPGPTDPDGLPYLGDSCLYQGGHLLGHTSAEFPICSHLNSVPTLTDSGTTYGADNSLETGFGDFDGDGDLDAYVANGYDVANRVLLNDGTGTFTDTGQTLGSASSNWASIGDLDGDGDLDAFVANGVGPQQVWVNDGTGTFSAGQSVGDDTWGANVASLGDLDGDGDLDAFFATSGLNGNQVWLNNGSGTFTDTGQTLGSLSSAGLGLGDFDGDGDLDAYFGNYSNAEDEIWLNDGSGTFTDSTQNLGSATTYGVNVGDLDGDGDLDACAIKEYVGCELWFNDGSAVFTSGGNVGTGNRTVEQAFGDIDGDGDLDIYLAKSHDPDEIWLNDGVGAFTNSGISIPNYTTYGVFLGDLDHDGDLDIHLSIFGANRVFVAS